MYRLNKATNVLEAYDETNIQDFVNSYRDTALSSVLEKYLPVPDAADDVVGEYMNNLDDLDYLTEAQATAENLRSKYNLGEDLDWKQIFGEVSKRRFSAPSLSIIDNVAVRDFKVYTAKNPLKSDLSLYRVGSFDIETGEVKPLFSELLFNGSDIKDVGQLIPLKPREVLAGDSFKVDSCAVARVASSFIKPVMDNLYLETYHFYVPYRLLYDKTERVFGNASPSAYEDNDLAKFPSFDDSGEDTITISQNSIGDYLGYPVGTISSKDVSVLPFRAYALVVDKWFRNENIIDEIYVQKGEFNNELPNNDDFAPDNYMGKPFNVGRRKDYFTSCLPAPQKGVPQGLQLTFSNDTFAPVYPKDPNNDLNIHDPSKLPDYGDLSLGDDLPDSEWYDLFVPGSQLPPFFGGGAENGESFFSRTFGSGDYKNSKYLQDSANAFNALEADKSRVFNAEEAEKARNFSAQEALKQREFEERLSNSAYQRAAQDLKNAGLNPYLLYGSAGSATTPAGSSAQTTLASSTPAHSGGISATTSGLANSAISAIASIASAVIKASA
ncbi:unnamed protein product [Cylicocyclus nassatus]|uniref:Uncharacterized protein n=1 Tax=Cylicocyclus nassatus TaxID=53992 RepID=A0AA36M6B0_CYLNA|nr:unnamed protein product [Cylicocyclus nassatus]CAJ0600723.1 unnamed protein product [Cylicocyclus nassatus]CAJ0600724.1 unnamed protein product [Cylicocyclus nassatus]